MKSKKGVTLEDGQLFLSAALSQHHFTVRLEKKIKVIFVKSDLGFVTSIIQMKLMTWFMNNTMNSDGLVIFRKQCFYFITLCWFNINNCSVFNHFNLI